MRDSFRTKTINGVKTYFYNGKKVSKEIFDKQRAAAKQRQTEILGISKEDFKKETPQQRKKRMMLELENLADGGEIKPKKKPLSPRQKALIDSANRIRKLEAAEERTKGITPKVKPKKPKLANGGLVSGKAQAKKYFTGVF